MVAKLEHATEDAEGNITPKNVSKTTRTDSI